MKTNRHGKPRIYMDHNATTQPRPEVVESMIPYYRDIFGNASSVHQFGKDAHKGLDEAKVLKGLLLLRMSFSG